MNITIKQLRKLIREELKKSLEEDLWSNSYGYDEKDYDEKGHHKNDIDNLENDLPEDTLNLSRNK